MIDLKVLTPDKTVYTGTVSEITIPTQAGEITVLPNHAPLVSVLKLGELRIRKDGEETSFAISTGVVEVRQSSEVIILARTTEPIEEIDLKRAEEAYARAAELLEKKDLRDPDYERIKDLVDRNLNRIHLVQRRSHHTSTKP